MEGTRNPVAILFANAFTAFRFAASPLIPVAIYFQTNPLGIFWELHWGTGVLLLAIATALTDAIDGFIAKFCGGVTELGTKFDPLADKVHYVSLFVAVYAWHGTTLYSVLAFGPPALVGACYAYDMTLLRIRGKVLAARSTAKLKAVVQAVSLLGLLAPFAPSLPWWGELNLPSWWEPTCVVGLWISMVLMLESWRDYYRNLIPQLTRPAE